MPEITLLDRLKEFLLGRRFRWILTIFFGVLVVLYFAFVTFLFDPFEDDLGDMAEIVPRNVDYFLRWKDAGARFDDFPTPAIWGEFEGSPLHGQLTSAGILQKLDQEWGVTRSLQDLGRIAADLPAALNLESDLLRELAVAGKGYPEMGSAFDGVLMFRVSFKIKAAVSLLDFGFVRNKLPDSVAIVAEGGDLYRLPQFESFGGKDAWLTRVRDVVLLASSKEWITAAEELHIRGGEGSLGPSSIYHDNVTDYIQDRGGPIELFFRWDKLKSQIGRWPDAGPTDSFPVRLWSRFMDSDLAHTVAGYWLPGMRFEGRVTGAIDLDEGNDFMRRWYESEPMRQKKIEDFSDWVPSDSFFFTGVGGSPDRVLVEMSAALDEEARRFFDEIIINTGKYQGIGHLLQDMGSMLSPGMFLAMRRNDYPPNPSKDVEHDDTPVPVFALMAHLRDGGAAVKKYEELMDFFKARSREFSRDTRLTEVPVAGNVLAISFASPAVPGTGEIVVLKVPSTPRPAVIISNSYNYVNQMMRIAFRSSGRGEKLTETDGFQQTLSSLDRGTSNLFFYLDPSEATYWLDKQAAEVALDQFRGEMRESGFYDRNRAQVEQRAKDLLFGGQEPADAAGRVRLQEEMDRLFLEMTADERRRKIPGMQQAIIEERLPILALDWLSVSLRTSRRSMQMLISGALNFENPGSGIE